MIIENAIDQHTSGFLRLALKGKRTLFNGNSDKFLVIMDFEYFKDSDITKSKVTLVRS